VSTRNKHKGQCACEFVDTGVEKVETLILKIFHSGHFQSTDTEKLYDVCTCTLRVCVCVCVWAHAHSIMYLKSVIIK